MLLVRTYAIFFVLGQVFGFCLFLSRVQLEQIDQCVDLRDKIEADQTYLNVRANVNQQDQGLVSTLAKRLVEVKVILNQASWGTCCHKGQNDKRARHLIEE